MRGGRGERHLGRLTTRAFAALALACLLTAGSVGLASADIAHYYDILGRLVGVSDPSDTAQYAYDEVGNLLSVTRYASSTVSIIDFQPSAGPVGTIVTIQGTGFSTTPAVTFNGVSAIVTSSTATSLVVPVPAGATTGTIGLTTPAGSVTSASSFTVTAAISPPTITSFLPTVGVPGTSVTITGTNFEPVPSDNRVWFYRVPPARSFATAAAATSLDVPVPANARSGPLTVSTPNGTAVSAADFFVPSGTYTAAQVAFTGRLVVGGSSLDVPLTSTFKLALVVFDGLAGQRLDLGTKLLSGFGTPTVTVYRPDGIALATTGSSSARYLPLLPVSGVYTIGMENAAASHTIRLTLSEEVTASTVVGDAPLNLSVPRAGQRARVSFARTAGQRVSVALTQTFAGSTVYLKAPDETPLVSINIGSTAELQSPVLPSTGTYLLVIEPSSAATGSFTATLSDDVTASITIDGSSVPISITRAGQRARVTVPGTAGQSPSLGITSATASGAVTVYKPGGATHVATTNFGTPAADVNFPAFTSTGTHEILIDPNGVTTANLTSWLSSPVTATTVLDGSPLSLAITRPGQYALATFPGTANQRASHVLSGTTVSGLLILMRPDGTVTHWPPLPGTTFVEPYSLPLSGTYYILVEPNAGNTGSATVTSYNVPPDQAGSLTINGGTVPVSLSVPGHNAVLSFSGTAGQTITVRLTSNTFGCVGFLLTKPPPGGTSGNSTCSGSYTFGVALTTTGTHTLKIDPQGAATGGATVEVTIP